MSRILHAGHLTSSQSRDLLIISLSGNIEIAHFATQIIQPKLRHIKFGPVLLLACLRTLLQIFTFVWRHGWRRRDPFGHRHFSSITCKFQSNWGRVEKGTFEMALSFWNDWYPVWPPYLLTWGCLAWRWPRGQHWWLRRFELIESKKAPLKWHWASETTDIRFDLPICSPEGVYPDVDLAVNIDCGLDRRTCVQ